MHTGQIKNGRVKSIMKKEEDVSTGDIEEDSFADDSSVSSGSRHDSDANGSSHLSPEPANRRKARQIAGRETTFVLCSKTVAYLVLLLSAIACGVVTYYFIAGEEKESFERDVCVI